jgi:hypothetical protein
MYIVLCNSTHTVEGSYVHCNVQQYTDSGGFVCILYVNLYTTYASAQVRYLNVRSTNAPDGVCCSDLNAQYTHVEA